MLFNLRNLSLFSSIFSLTIFLFHYSLLTKESEKGKKKQLYHASQCSFIFNFSSSFYTYEFTYMLIYFIFTDYIHYLIFIHLNVYVDSMWWGQEEEERTYIYFYENINNMRRIWQSSHTYVEKNSSNSQTHALCIPLLFHLIYVCWLHQVEASSKIYKDFILLSWQRLSEIK